MQSFILTVHIVVALMIIVLVLLQQGKGAETGASFGSGASGTIFGAQGAANFLSHTTAVCALIFMLTSLSLGYFSSHGLTGSLKSVNAVNKILLDSKEPSVVEKKSDPKSEAVTKTDSKTILPD